MNASDDTVKRIREQLLQLRDEKYREFQCKLMPTVDPQTVIGVRTPDLRRLVKEIPDGDAGRFLKSLPHIYYEENNLHGLIIDRIRDYDECIAALDAFLPHVDNWATCDMMSPKTFKKHPPQLINDIERFIASQHTYSVRFGIGVLMSFYLDEYFSPDFLEMVASIESNEYYVNMMRAWYFATALAKQYALVVGYVESHRLDSWTHNKTIQKAIESYRVSDERKSYLRTLKSK